MVTSNRKKKDNELLRKEALFKATFESAGDGIVVVDNNGKIIHYNEQFGKMWGIPPAILKTKDEEKFLKFVLDQLEEPVKFKSKVQQLYTSFDDDYDVLKFKDKRIIERISRPLIIDKEIEGRIWNFKDITREKQIEENLTKSEEKYRSLYENAPVMLHSIDYEGRFISVSNYWLEVLGYKREEVIGRKSTEFLTEESRKYANEVILPEFFVTGYCTEVPYQYIKKNGDKIDVLLSAISEKDDDGRVIRSLAVLIDITERKKAEEMMKLNEMRLRQIIDLDPNFIFAKDIEGRFFLVNKAVADAYGTTVNKLLGKKDADFAKSDEEVKFFREKDLEVMKMGKPLVIPEEKITYANGEVRYLQTIKIPFTFSGTTSPAMLGVSNDITKRKLAEEKLRNSEKLLSNFFNSPGIGRGIVEIVNDDVLFISVNEAAKDFHGLTKEEMENKFSRELKFPEKLKNLWVKNYRESQKTGKPVTFEYYSEDFGKWYLAIASFIGIEESGNPRFTYILRDTTERKKSEQENTLLAQTLKSVKDSVTVTDMSDRILFVNDAFLAMYGYNEDELKGKKISEVRSAEIPEELSDKIYSDTLKGGWHGELINRRKDGSKFSIELWTSLVKDVNNKNIATVGLARDITERKQAEKALRESEEKYRSLLENVNIGVFRTSPEGLIMQVNPAFNKIFEYDNLEEIMKTNVSELYHHKEDRKLFLQEMNQEGYVHNRELRLKKKDGTLIWAALTAQAFFDDNHKMLWIDGVIDDITELKKANEELIKAKEKAEESERIKSNFLANMSHELRTPMVGILGYSEFLRQSRDSEVKFMADTINLSGTRLLETLNLILDLSRIEREMLEVNFEKIDIISVARDVINLFKVSAEKKNLKLELVSADEHFYANLDERILHQIFNNLINNAIKYTHSGGVTVEISSDKKEEKEEVVIKVKDTGIGIPEEKQNIIFEEFRQVSEGLNRTFEGTGLGLTITKHFVEAMKGKITLESRLGKGSVFTVRLPLKELSAAKIKAKEIPRKTIKELSLHDNYNVLCVDDDEINNTLVKFILKKHCNIEFALNDKTALNLVEKKKYNAILMDINLGSGKSGIEAVGKIRKIPGYKKTPIIALTAFAMKGDKEEFLSMGCDYYLSKPYTGEELKAVVAKALHLAINN